MAEGKDRIVLNVAEETGRGFRVVVEVRLEPGLLTVEDAISNRTRLGSALNALQRSAAALAENLASHREAHDWIYARPAWRPGLNG